MESNQIGNYFELNMFGDFGGQDFDFNRIGSYFTYNFLTFNNNDFINNNIGDTFNNNIIDSGFLNNTIVGDFYGNLIINQSFNDNFIGKNFYNNIIPSSFYSNNIGDNFNTNTIYFEFRKNSILNYFNTTTIGGVNNLGLLFENNQIMNNFKGNDIQGNFWSNQIKTDFKGNDVFDEFGYNNIGFGCSPNSFSGITIHNNIGDYFSFNTCYGSFSYNTIGTYFNSNEVQDGFGFGGSSSQGNRIGNDFNDNTIGEYFYNNTIPDNFQNNEVGDSFQWNIVNTDVVGTCLSTGMLYDITTVNVFKNKNGDNRLSYYDELDVLTIETLTEAPCLGGLNALDIPENDLNFGLVINPSFTLSSTDFIDFGYGGGVTPNGTLGFTTDGLYDAGTSVYNAYNFVGDKNTEINAFFNNNGLLTNGTGYIFDVTWGAGSSISPGKVLMGFNGTYLLIAPINTGNNDWQTPGQSNFDIESIAGTFNFTAAFTLYSPITAQGNSWC